MQCTVFNNVRSGCSVEEDAGATVLQSKLCGNGVSGIVLRGRGQSECCANTMEHNTGVGIVAQGAAKAVMEHNSTSANSISGVGVTGALYVCIWICYLI